MAGVCMGEDRITPRAAIRKGLTVAWVLAYAREDFERVIRHMEPGKIDCDATVSAVIGPDALPDMFEALRTPNDHLKVLIDPAPAGRAARS